MSIRTTQIRWHGCLFAILVIFAFSAHADVRTDSWLTTNSAAYARVYRTTANRTSGTSFTTWTNQSLPSYSDIQMVLTSASWTYVRYSGLSSYIMGPWLTPQGGVFQFWPTNQHGLRRFPRSPVVQSGNKDSTQGGYSGLFVNGVAIFNSLDGQAWNGSAIQGQSPHTQTNYFWHRNAPVAEAFNFDGALGHQPPSAVYHNHQNPIALRYQLGDNVNYNSSTKLYSEITNTAPTAHSPIVGWAHDGYPIYGPYGYSTAMDSGSGIRRMISGYAKRDGSNGTDTLSTNLAIIPAWYARFRQKLGAPYSTTASTSRAPINATYPLGVFAEDWAYLGDLGKTQGTDFDLDQYNGRNCVTPEFPGGTYAYFTTIDADGESTYPYILAYEFYGDATGGSVSSISETVTTNFIGGQNVSVQLNTPAVNPTNSTVTLVWSSVEGGTYQVETSTNQSTWTTLLTNISAKGVSTTTNFTGSNGTSYARVTRTALASYDAVYSGGSSVQTDTESYTVNTLSIDTQPQSQTVSPGGDATFTVVASGVAPITFQWRFNTTNISGATDSSYTRNSVSDDDEGSYSVIVSNVTGSITSDDAILTVAFINTAPTLTSISTFNGGIEDTAFALSYANLLNASDAADVDGDAISFRIESITSGVLTMNGTNVVAGSTLLSTNENLSWIPATNANGTLGAFAVRAWDGQSASASAVQVSVNVAAVSDRPIVANPLSTQSATYGNPFTYTFSANTFFDADGDELTYSMNMSETFAFPFWLSLDSPTRTFTGTPTDSGTYALDLKASDGTEDVFTFLQIDVAKASLTVTPSNVFRFTGEANPPLTGNISGIKNGDDITVTYSTTATTESPVGTYPITATLNDPNERLTNYNVTINQGTLTVTDTPPPPEGDPRMMSWITDTSGQYVRLYTNAAAKAAGITVTTWTFSSMQGTNVTGTQALPVYSGVQEIYSSSNWVYIRSSAMPASPIGPLIAYAPAALILPTNQKSTYRIPRNATVPGSKTLTGGGAIGYLLDGVQMFDTRDALSWNGTTEGMGSGYWTRDAYVNEGYGFDPVQGHSSPGGAYHYHSNPAGLRYRLNDHVEYNSTTKTYFESTDPVTEHSPILGWVRDGFPLYGPYGYSSASNSASGIRRMISGFVLRNGQNGTANLSVTGRTNIPLWAQRMYGVSTATGPSVASYGPLGRYLEDNDYLGDLINPNTSSYFIKGVDFDLDEYNGRWCVTPEFPNGTYAYFVTIETNGAPKYPYYIGRAFFGNPTGGTVSNLTEMVMTNFVGGTNMPLHLTKPGASNGLITLVWSAVEGGTYKVESSSSLTNWTNKATNILARGSVVQTNLTGNGDREFYRITRTSVANYDPVGTGGGGGGGGGTNSVAPGGSASRGTTVTVTITLPTNPPLPPANVVPASITLAGSISGTNISRPTQGTAVATFAIPANAPTGAQNIVVVFSPGPTYTLTGGFTIQ